MAKTKVVGAVGNSYHLGDRKAAVQSAVNCYLQRLEGDNFMMASAPGEALVMALGGEGRANRNVEGRWFLVVGDALYECTSSGSYVVRGRLLTETGFVGMSHSTTQLVIVDGDGLYVLTLATNVFTQINSPGWRGSDDVYELDGYFIFVDPGTDQFYLSAIDDASNFDALDFSSADASPDNIVTHRISHRQLLLFGAFSTEIWVETAEILFPFSRYTAYTIDVGVVGKRAVINAADTLFFVGQTRTGFGVVYMLVGNQPQRVSTMAVEEALRASTDISKVTMWAYQIEGHEFIGITAPGLSTTWVYDAALQGWHERGEWDNGFKPLRSGKYIAFEGGHYGVDEYGNVTRLDVAMHSFVGRPLVRERTWPHLIQSSLEPISFLGVELSMTTGNGGVVTLEISNDNGITFGAPLPKSLGAIGRFMQRIRWNGLGVSRARVFRIRVSDEVPFALHSAAVVT